MTNKINENSASNKLITLMSSGFIHEIHIAQGKLKNEGIQSFIADENLSTIGFVAEYRLQIRSFDLLKANAILNRNTK